MSVPAVQQAPDSRPPAEAVGLRLLPDPVPVHQPALPLVTPERPAVPVQAWTGTPVLEADSWAATLAVAVFEALHGRRPIGQLTRWVDDRVQASLAFHRRRAGAATAGRSAVLLSLRVQHPRPDAAEVCAHLVLDGRSHALALRLEVWGERWLCTAAAFTPPIPAQPGVTAPRTARGTS